MSEPKEKKPLLRRETLAAFGSGVVFAVGLALAGMTRPAKVVGFLDFAGDWDPSLAFVMGGAILIYATLNRRVTVMKAPVLGGAFSLPSKTDIEPRLVAGAALFGVGWGLGGFCPGPALASLGTGSTNVLIFVGAMLGGMLLFRLFDSAQAKRAAARATDG